jgi:hypothetical protein
MKTAAAALYLVIVGTVLAIPATIGTENTEVRKRFVVRANEKQTAFIELESAARNIRVRHSIAN